MKNILIYFLFLLIAGLSFISCEKEEEIGSSNTTIQISGVPQEGIINGAFTDSVIADITVDAKIKTMLFTMPVSGINVTTNLTEDPLVQGLPDSSSVHVNMHTATLGDPKGYRNVEGATKLRLTIAPKLLNQLPRGGFTMIFTVKDYTGESTTEVVYFKVVPAEESFVTVALKLNGVTVPDTIRVDGNTVVTIIPTSSTNTPIRYVTINDTNIELEDSVYSYTLTSSDTFRIKAKDINGVESEEVGFRAELNVKDAEAFTWNLDEGDTLKNADLARYGLTYIDNGDGTTAIIGTEENSKMVKLSADDWDKITYQDTLRSVIDAGTALTQYKGIDAQADKIYENEYLGTKVEKGEEGNTQTVYYMIKISSSEVNLDGGTDSTTLIKVMGEVKDDNYTNIE